MTYQVPRVFPKPRNFEYDLSNTDVFLKCMTKPAYYIHFLNSFKREIASKGMGEVMKEYVFKGDERANRILTRLYDGESLKVWISFCALELLTVLDRGFAWTHTCRIRIRV